MMNQSLRMGMLGVLFVVLILGRGQMAFASYAYDWNPESQKPMRRVSSSPTFKAPEGEFSDRSYSQGREHEEQEHDQEKRRCLMVLLKAGSGAAGTLSGAFFSYLAGLSFSGGSMVVICSAWAAFEVGNQVVNNLIQYGEEDETHGL